MPELNYATGSQLRWLTEIVNDLRKDVESLQNQINSLKEELKLLNLKP